MLLRHLDINITLNSIRAFISEEFGCFRHSVALSVLYFLRMNLIAMCSGLSVILQVHSLLVLLILRCSNADEIELILAQVFYIFLL